jgi:hypothetical protein
MSSLQRGASSLPVTPRFDFDDQTGRPIKRLAGIPRNVGRTEALLRFLESTSQALVRPRPLGDPG